VISDPGTQRTLYSHRWVHLGGGARKCHGRGVIGGTGTSARCTATGGGGSVREGE
jgi:hypothetical protein